MITQLAHEVAEDGLDTAARKGADLTMNFTVTELHLYRHRSRPAGHGDSQCPASEGGWDVVAAFADLAAAAQDCPRGCTHLGPPADPECALDLLEGKAARRVEAVRLLLTAVSSNDAWDRPT